MYIPNEQHVLSYKVGLFLRSYKQLETMVIFDTIWDHI